MPVSNKSTFKTVTKSTPKISAKKAVKNAEFVNKRSTDMKKKSASWLVKDTIVLGCIGLSFFLFLVLFSYEHSDPGFEVASASKNILNYGGKTGAWIASFFFYVFGVFSLLIPFGILLAGMVTLKIRADSPLCYSRFFVSMIGLILLIVTGSGLTSLYMEPIQSYIHLPYSAGGVIGYELSTWLVSSIDLLGTTLVFLILFIISFSLFTSFSWLTILDYTGQLIWQGIDKLKPHVMPYVERVKEKNKQWRSIENNAQKPVDLVIKTKEPPANLSVLKTMVGKVKEKAQKVKDTKKEIPAKLAKPINSKETAENDEDKQELKVGNKVTANSTVPINESGELPSLELLNPIQEVSDGFSTEELTNLSALLEQRLKEFGVSIQVEAVQPGPVVTRFEVLPAAGVKVSQILNLAKDLARVLSVSSVRVVDVIPGKSVVGIEIPNETRDIVGFKDILASDAFQNSKSPLTIALGKDIAGEAVVADIAKMPHLLVAGTTGSGKSVGVNSMILSLLYKSTPEQVRLIMIDPKMLELSVYEDIPHLLTPVVTDMSEAANSLRWCVFEMDRRYQLMAKLGVRSIAGFNEKVKAAIDSGEPMVDPLYKQAANFGHELGEQPPTLEPLPYIVVIVDEFADMIMVVGKEVEQLISRIAQKARAAGIHLILATQRPSVNVITGLIKANIPTRISFMVNTKIDSRTILDQGGAEQLLGMGDMLFMPPGSGNPRRVHGAFMTDEEVHRVASFVKSQGPAQYLESVTQSPSEVSGDSIAEDAEQDLLYDQVVAFVAEKQKVSVSLVQRQFKIGYNRAARIVEAMEGAGLVSAQKGSGNREVLVGKPSN